MPGTTCIPYPTHALARDGRPDRDTQHLSSLPAKRRRNAALRASTAVPANRASRTTQRARKAATTRRRDWKPDFLEALRSTGLVTHACRLAQVGRQTAYDARETDPDFAAEWAEVNEEALEKAEREAYRRAVEGVDKPVFQGGEEVGLVREYSDGLLQFILKANRPEKYRENLKVEHSGSVRHDLAAMDDRSLEQLAAGLTDKRARE